MNECFRQFRISVDKRAKVRQANAIIAEYQAQGLRLTLRQLYYQHVARDLIPNSQKSYKTLGKLISDGRLAGLIDWNAIEDRVRRPLSPSEFNDLDQLMDAALFSYRLPRWRGQKHYVELWIEKDALSGVLAPIANEFHITLMVNRGYSSQSAMYEASKRFINQESDKSSTIVYLGDHDPSGEDMVRDIQERMEMFGSSVNVEKIALTMDQVEQYDPPPNPAKMSDSRAEKYVEKHGDQSWEVDALPPDVLNKLIRARLEDLVDRGLMAKIINQEDRDKNLLRRAVKKLRSKKKI